MASSSTNNNSEPEDTPHLPYDEKIIEPHTESSSGSDDDGNKTSSSAPIDNKFYEIYDIYHESILIGHIILDNEHIKDATDMIISMQKHIEEKKIRFKKPSTSSDLFYKTEQCRNEFDGRGKCTYGIRCKFAHTTHELIKNQERCVNVTQFIE